MSQSLTTSPSSCYIYERNTTLGRNVGSTRLENARKAHQAVCDMLQFKGLSVQTERQLQNLKRLLELEIGAAESAPGESDEEEATG
jgi:hypothetical protein